MTIKVLHILEATQGGTRRHALDLLPALNARGVRGDIAYSPLPNPHFGVEVEAATQGKSLAFPVRMARTLNPAYHGIALRHLRHLIRRGGYDLIHCHSTVAGLAGRLATLGAGCRLPVVYTPHCPIFATGLPASQRRVGLVLERLLASRTTRFIAVSQWERNALIERGIGNRDTVECVHNGLDIAAFDACARLHRGQLMLGEDEFVIGCIDRLSRQKNQIALVQALASLDMPWRLLLVGGGESRAAVGSVAEQLGIGGRIVWAGTVMEVPPYYDVCDVIAHPSRWDSCPYTVLEAMAAARPVVAADIGGVAELLGSAGLLFAPHDIEAFATHLLALGADEQLRRALGVAGRVRLGERFQLGPMIEATIAVYAVAVK